MGTHGIHCDKPRALRHLRVRDGDRAAGRDRREEDGLARRLGRGDELQPGWAAVRDRDHHGLDTIGRCIDRRLDRRDELGRSGLRALQEVLHCSSPTDASRTEHSRAAESTCDCDAF